MSNTYDVIREGEVYGDHTFSGDDIREVAAQFGGVIIELDDGKVELHRSKQTKAEDYDTHGRPELVIREGEVCLGTLFSGDKLRDVAVQLGGAIFESDGKVELHRNENVALIPSKDRILWIATEKRARDSAAIH